MVDSRVHSATWNRYGIVIVYSPVSVVARAMTTPAALARKRVWARENTANGGRNSLSNDDHGRIAGHVSHRRCLSSGTDRIDLCRSGPHCDRLGGTHWRA